MFVSQPGDSCTPLRQGQELTVWFPTTISWQDTSYCRRSGLFQLRGQHRPATILDKGYACPASGTWGPDDRTSVEQVHSLAGHRSVLYVPIRSRQDLDSEPRPVTLAGSTVCRERKHPSDSRLTNKMYLPGCYGSHDDINWVG